MICDFCSSPHVAAEFPANDFVIPELESEDLTPASRGSWCACPECAELVQLRDWEALARRAAELFCTKNPYAIDCRAEIQDMLFAMYAGMLEPQLAGTATVLIPEGGMN